MNDLLEIVGPYPPPLGGISIHISRMEFFLKKEKINYKIYNHGYFSSEKVVATNKSAFWYIKYLFGSKARVIHFHQFFIFHYFFYYIFSKIRKKKIIITIHSEKILHSNNLLKKICISLLKKTNATALICVSRNLSDFLNSFNVNNRWLPAIVPPAEINSITLEKIPGKEYFLYSIWKIDNSKTNEIYNIELALKLISKVKTQFQMLFLIGTKKESDIFYLNSLMEKYSVKDSITIIYEGNLVSYLNNCKFLLRTNNSDGYGVSIQEALNLKIPAIASDVCIRPKGTILFEKGNLEDLYEKIINMKKYWKESEIEITNYHLQLIELYKTSLKNL